MTLENLRAHRLQLSMQLRETHTTFTMLPESYLQERRRKIVKEIEKTDMKLNRLLKLAGMWN